MDQENQSLGREVKPVTGSGLSSGGETLLADLHNLAAKLLEMQLADLDVNKPFLEIGADSIVLINLIRAVDEKFGVKIRVRQIFEGLNTLALLADYLDQQGACFREKQNVKIEEVALAHGVDERTASETAGKSDIQGSLSAGLESKIEMTPGIVERVIMQQLKMFEQQLNVLRTVDAVSAPSPASTIEQPMYEPRDREGVISSRGDGGSLGFWTRPRSNGGVYRVEDRETENVAASSVDFSLYYFGCYDDDYRADKYDLLIDGARYADAQGLSAVWIPERHFHEFGGISPNPSVVAAALARETSRIELRPGSVVLPLHHPLRVAEEWSVVDNLSGGRVGLGVASGWHPRDFVFAPENFGKHRELTFERIDTLQRIWRGESVSFVDGTGKDAQITIFPKPRQAELPIWLTIVNNPETYIKAGELGVGVLTNLMGQSIDDLKRNIGLYQQALVDHGHGLGCAKVTVLVHTYIDSNAEKARSKSKEPLFNYFKSTVALFQSLVKSQGLGVDFDTLSNDDREALFEQAFERYVNSSALVGSPQDGLRLVERLKSVGVTEIACLIDFGIDYEGVMRGLEQLVELRDLERSARDQSGEERGLSQPATGGYKLLPLTPMQRQMWLLSQMGGGASAAYNEGVALELVGDLDIGVLNRAIERVVNRHESLRASIDGAAGICKIRSSVKVAAEFFDLSDLGEKEQRARIGALLREESRYIFDMAVAPMFRAIVIKTDQQRHLLSVMDHHIVSDGWSLGVILREIGELYTWLRNDHDASFAEPMQFGAYANVIRQSERKPEYLAHEQFWMKQYADTPPVLELPVDHPRPPVKTYNGERYSFRLEKRSVSALRQVGGSEGCTLFMVVFAAYALMIHRLSGQDDVVIGTPVAGRLIEGSERCVGYCLNLLP
ncbi:MAG: LLM class flavin-dependent oxidoreductase, partial [Candidatus Thiodiazotropha sp.]